MGTSWMFCSRFCAVTMISVNTCWFAACCAQLEPAATAPDIANARATPCRKRRIVIALPLIPFFSSGVILCAPLWIDRHNMPVSSLREGWGRHLASGVNLLTLGAIPGDRAGCPIQQRHLLYFRYTKLGGLQVGASSSESSHAKSGQMVADGAGRASSPQTPWPGRGTARHARHASRRAGGVGVDPAVGG